MHNLYSRDDDDTSSLEHKFQKKSRMEESCVLVVHYCE